MANKPKNTVPILLKAVDILEAIAQGRVDTSTRSLATELKIPQSTCYRILQSFASKDWLRSVPGGGYEISFGIMPLLDSFANHELLVETVRAALNALARKTGLTVKMSIRQGSDAVTICRAESPKATSVNVRLGSKFHLSLGSSGAIFLSQLDEIAVAALIANAPAECWANQKESDVRARINSVKKHGYAVDMGSYRRQLNAISAPLVLANGQVIAAVTIIGFGNDFLGKRDQIRGELLYTVGGCNRLVAGLNIEPSR